MDTIKAANKIIKEGIRLLPDDAKAEFKANASDISIDEAINNACGAINGNEEKEAMLAAYAVQEANRVASTLWRLQLLPEDLEKEYRKLPTTTEVVKPYNEFIDARNARSEELNVKGKELQEEKRDLDIFMGIINGIPASESEKRYDAFKKQQQAALGGAR